MESIDRELLLRFVRFQTARSGGSGGQHVNKVETKVILLFDLELADFLTGEQKARIKTRLSNWFQSTGLLQVTSQQTRSQLQNKEIALDKLEALLLGALKTEKPRKVTKPSKAAVQRRLDSKRRQALRKINRKGDWD